MMQQEKRKVSQPDDNGDPDEAAAAGISSQKIPRGPQQQGAGGGGGGGGGGANNIFNSLQAFNSFVSGIGVKNDGGNDDATAAAAGIGGGGGDDGANRAPLPFGASALTQLATKANRSQSASGPIGARGDKEQRHRTPSSPPMSRGSKLEAIGRDFFSTREVASPTRSSYPANDSPSPGEATQQQHPRSNSLPSSPPLNDDDVAKAYAAALSVSRLTDDEEFRLTHVGAATDDRQRRLLQRHRDEVAEREAAERVLNHQKFLRAQEEAAAKVGRSLQTHVKTLQGNWTKQREKLREGLKLPPLPGADRRGDADSDERNAQNDVAAKTSRGDDETSVDAEDVTVPTGVKKASVIEKKDSSARYTTQRSEEADGASKEMMTPGDGRTSDDHGKGGVTANVATTSGSGSADLAPGEEATQQRRQQQQQQQNKSILGLPGMPFLTPGGNGDGHAPPPSSDGQIPSANATGERDAVNAAVIGGASSSSTSDHPTHHDRYGRSNSAPTSPYNSFVGRKIGVSTFAGTRGGARAVSSPPDDLKHIGTGVLRDRLVGDAVVGLGDSSAPDAAKVAPSQPIPTGRQSPPPPQAAVAVAAAAAASAASATSSPAMCQTVWKRRDGLGKLSSNSWERRRLLLQDTKLIYFADDGESGGAGGSNSSLENLSGDKPAREPAIDEGAHGGTNGRSAKEHQQERPQFKMPQNKWQGGWIWEQAAAAVATNFSSIAAAAGNGPDDHPSGTDTGSSPRGCLDLVKEHASAAASMGTRQSGAPTPFALSVKVRGETKWKFCFDTHRDQLEWLTALSNVIVRHSMEVFVEEQASSREGVRVTCNLQGPFFSLHERPSGRSMSLDSNESLDVLPATASEVATPKSAATGEINASLRSSPNSGSCHFFPRGSKVDTARSLANVVLLILHYYSPPNRMFWVLFFCFNFFVWFVGKSEDKNRDQKKKKKKKSVPKRGSSASSISAALPHVRDEKKPRVLPVAGSSTVRLGKGEIARSSVSNRIQWRNVVGSDLQVRSVGYDKTRKKMPSRGSLYECTAVDVFVSESRVEDICTKVQLPKVNGLSKEGTKRWHSPDVFVVSVAIPTEAPKLGWPTEDGLGFTIAAYFTMREDTRQILEMISEPGYHPSKTDSSNSIDSQKINAVRLFEEWCRRSPNDAQFLGRFKFIPGAVNVEEIGLPSYILKYNGKPVLIKRSGVTGILSSHPGVMEFDINLHAFPYLAKQAFSYMFENQFSKVVCNLAFVIEGRCDDELPEVILGAVQLCYPDPQHAVQGENFLNGS